MDAETRDRIDEYIRTSLRAAIALTEHYHGRGGLERLRATIDEGEEQAERIDALVAALRDYGDHRPACRHLASSPKEIYPCNCGFFAAMEAAGVTAR